ncbi:MAG: NIL domain-containing protein [Planctomycetes bacterium]|nr:NIL domain-containing protein [Planctomycetota bacterium]NUQ33741.1 NIL domain-containing protein [Planctomycetaceae bacterium]
MQQSAKVTKHFNMSFSQQLIKEPLLYNLGLKFGVEFNITHANVSEAFGHLTLSLTGQADKLAEALAYLNARGVKVEEIPAPVTA